MRIRRGDSEVAAKTIDGTSRAVVHCGDNFDHRMTMFGRRLETEDVAHALEKGFIRAFGDAHGPVSLHVRMTAQGTHAAISGGSFAQLVQGAIGDFGGVL